VRSGLVGADCVDFATPVDTLLKVNAWTSGFKVETLLFEVSVDLGLVFLSKLKSLKEKSAVDMMVVVVVVVVVIAVVEVCCGFVFTDATN